MYTFLKVWNKGHTQKQFKKEVNIYSLFGLLFPKAFIVIGNGFKSL